jgi:profilin
MSLTAASLVGSGHLDKAAIFGAAGDSVWAQTAGYTVRGLSIDFCQIN